MSNYVDCILKCVTKVYINMHVHDECLSVNYSLLVVNP